MAIRMCSLYLTPRRLSSDLDTRPRNIPPYIGLIIDHGWRQKNIALHEVRSIMPFGFSHPSFQGRWVQREEIPSPQDSSSYVGLSSSLLRLCDFNITYWCTAHSPELPRPNRPSTSPVACPTLEADELQSRGRTVLSTCCGQSTGAG